MPAPFSFLFDRFSPRRTTTCTDPPLVLIILHAPAPPRPLARGYYSHLVISVSGPLSAQYYRTQEAFFLNFFSMCEVEEDLLFFGRDGDWRRWSSMV